MMAYHEMWRAILIGGILALLSAFWLSGYSFPIARRRATLSLLACLVPCVGYVVFAFF
jgi:hypothetical protein